jgi:hypothetical protein
MIVLTLYTSLQYIVIDYAILVTLVLYETVLTIACINANVIGLHTNLYRDIRIYK